MAHLHYVLDAYGLSAESGNSLISINELLVQLSKEMDLEAVMPPFLLPYYYSADPEDGGISAFVICRGGHITIHTFPYRSCYFMDILTDNLLFADKVEHFMNSYLYASNLNSSLIDRRFPDTVPTSGVDKICDFGPHYLISVKNMEMTFNGIFSWLDSIAEKVNMLPISRPYVIYDSIENPQFISGIIVVAQSHVAVHYSIKEKTANIDIFSCSFLENEIIERILKQSFGDNATWVLFPRGSKYTNKYLSRSDRITPYMLWKKNIK